MSELVSDIPSQPGLEINHLVELLRAHFLSSRQIPTSPGSRSPERVLIGTPAVGVKLMLVSTDLPSRTAARLAPLQVAEDDAACRYRRVT